MERKPTSSKVVFWLSMKSLRSISRCWLVCVSVAKDGCILSKRKAKVDCAYYAGQLLPNLVEDCNRLLPTRFIFQQDSTTAHTCTHNWLRANCPDFITNDQWPPNSPNLNPMGYHVWGAMLEAYRKLKTIAENNRRTQRSASGYLGQPATGTDRQGCERLLKVTEGLCWSWWWTLRTFTVTIELCHLIIS